MERAGELGHAPLEPEPLGLERERVRVAVGQRSLEPRERGRLLLRRWGGQKLVNLLEQGGKRIGGHRDSLDYRMGATSLTRAARPIRESDQAQT